MAERNRTIIKYLICISIHVWLYLILDQLVPFLCIKSMLNISCARPLPRRLAICFLAKYQDHFWSWRLPTCMHTSYSRDPETCHFLVREHLHLIGPGPCMYVRRWICRSGIAITITDMIYISVKHGISVAFAYKYVIKTNLGTLCEVKCTYPIQLGSYDKLIMGMSLCPRTRIVCFNMASDQLVRGFQKVCRELLFLLPLAGSCQC